MKFIIAHYLYKFYFKISALYYKLKTKNNKLLILSMCDLHIENICIICYNHIGDGMEAYFNYQDKYLLAHYSHDEHPDEANFKLHTHEWYEVYYFMHGGGSFKIEGTAYPLENGSLLIMRPAESHYIDIDLSLPYTRMSIHFNPEILSTIDPEQKLLFPFKNRKSGHLNLYKASDFENQNYKIFIRNMMLDSSDRNLQIISNLIPLLNEMRIAFLARPEEKNEETLVYKIIRFINEHYYQDITLDRICDEFFISKSQLCRTFKSATGSTVWKYVTVKRLVAAHDLIMTGKQPNDIYTKCGFNDYTSFFRAYKAHYGVSPTQKNKTVR